MSWSIMKAFDSRRNGTYRPKIKRDQLRDLWLLRQRTGRPITELVREALDWYLTCQDHWQAEDELSQST